MKKLFIAIIILCIFSKNNAQNTLNQRYTLGYLNTIFTGIYATDSIIYIKGVYTDTTFAEGTFLAKFKKNGDLVAKTEYYKGYKIESSSWFPELLLNASGNFVITGYQVIQTEPDTFYRSGFMIEMSEQGVLLNETFFESPYVPLGEDFISPLSIIIAKNGDYIMAGNISGKQKKSGFVARFDPNFEQKWILPIGDTILYEIMRSVTELDNGNIVIGGGINYGYIGQQLPIRHYTVTVDSAGQQVLDQWQSPMVWVPEGGGVLWDLLPQTDGSIIAAGSVTKETYVNADNNFVKDHPAVIKINANKTIGWKNKMGLGYYRFGGNNFLTQLLQADDGNIIAAGAGVGTYSTPDTTVFLSAGLIEKLSPQGDSIWLRYLYHPPINGRDSDHQITGIAEAPDNSGYWICGQAIVALPGVPYQQGWLLFVDNYGCMVPGCQLVGTQEKGADIGANILVYPNPVSSSLAVFHAGYPFSKGRFRIVSTEGRIMQEWISALDDVTDVLEVNTFAPGTYWLQYEENGVVLASKQVVKM